MIQNIPEVFSTCRTLYWCQIQITKAKTILFIHFDLSPANGDYRSKVPERPVLEIELSGDIAAEVKK